MALFRECASAVMLLEPSDELYEREAQAARVGDSSDRSEAIHYGDEQVLDVVFLASDSSAPSSAECSPQTDQMGICSQSPLGLDIKKIFHISPILMCCTTPCGSAIVL